MSVSIVYDKGRLVALGDTYPHRETLKGAGFRWDPALRVWWAPRPELVRAELVDRWLSQEAQAVLEQVRERVRLSKAAQAEVDVPVPPGQQLLPFQKAGVAYALRTLREGRGVLIGDEMGLGKTVQAIAVANGLRPRTVLVVCPASLKLNWLREWERWSVLPLSVGVAQPREWPQTDVVIVNYDILTRYKEQLGRGWDLLILDEAHKIKNPKAQRTEAALAIPVQHRVYLTGTPLLNRPVELWPLVSSLDPERFRSFWAFAKRYCNARQVPAGRRLVWDLNGASNLGELQDLLRSRVLVRRLKREVLAELPPKVRQVIEVRNGTTPEVEREEEALDRFRAWYEEARALVDLAAASGDTEAWKAQVERLREGVRAFFSEISELRHQTARAKVPYVIEHVRDALESVHKCVVFAHHHDVIAALAEGLAEYRPVVVTGETPVDQRQRAVDAFQNDPGVRVFIGSITAAGLGLTLTAASLVVFAELDWVPANVTQAEDRCHRIGQRDSVLVQHLVLEGSLDARIARVLVEKQDLLDRVLDRESAEEATQPVSPLDPEPRHESRRRRRLEELAARISPELVVRIHWALKLLAAMDWDRARFENGVGFSKYDGKIGHSLAQAGELTPRQAALGALLVLRYHRQLDPQLVEDVRAVVEEAQAREQENRPGTG